MDFRAYFCILLMGCPMIAEASVLSSKDEPETHRREKRQLGKCSWGQPAVSGCFSNRACNHGYQCDWAAGNDGRGRCCLPNLGGTPDNSGGRAMPTCRDGNPVVASCIGGLCGNGLICSTSDNYCCLSGTAASCNFVSKPTTRCFNGACSPGQYCSRDGYCCAGTDGGSGTGVCPYNAPSAGSCTTAVQCQAGYVCANNICCALNSLRCNNGVTVPTGACIAGQCPQQTPTGVPQAQQCEQPYNLCCPV